jgi:UPF0755 protein
VTRYGSSRGPLLAGLSGALYTLLAVVVVLGVFSAWLYLGPGPRARSGVSTTVMLRRGAGLSEIGGDLKRAGVVASSPLFIAAADLARGRHGLKAGEYAFPSRASLHDVIARMKAGLIVHHRVTVPEGLSSRQVADLLAASAVLTGPVSAPPEGSVLPETYEVVRGDTRASVLARMSEARDRLLATLWASRKPNLPFVTPEQAVTLASIVEKETALPAERPHVAAVYVNRLRQAIKLEADPTIIYAAGNGLPLGHPILASELAAPGPYNTYLNTGLPPTPIDNPGRASLAAALDPSDSDDLYFVATGQGGHVFSKSLAEHDKNVARWREAQKAATAHALLGAPIPPPVEHR